jgi:hypothetical protein
VVPSVFTSTSSVASTSASSGFSRWTVAARICPQQQVGVIVRCRIQRMKCPLPPGSGFPGVPAPRAHRTGPSPRAVWPGGRPLQLVRPPLGGVRLGRRTPPGRGPAAAVNLQYHKPVLVKGNQPSPLRLRLPLPIGIGHHGDPPQHHPLSSAAGPDIFLDSREYRGIWKDNFLLLRRFMQRLLWQSLVETESTDAVHRHSPSLEAACLAWPPRAILLSYQAPTSDPLISPPYREGHPWIYCHPRY